MSSVYNLEEKREIERCYALVEESVDKLHFSLGQELNRAFSLVHEDVGDPTFAKVLVVGELLRGILKDQRSPISSNTFIISAHLRKGLAVAHTVGLTLAPFALRNSLTGLRKLLRREPPHFSHAAKMAILQCQMAHAMSQNRSKIVSYSIGQGPKAGSTKSIQRF
jgi:hypothetical protein